ncbi:class I SAM-dependent methyltransferase [Iningainema tapete]|uniref:Class I SAM-dependent methyltransferase n=1 Tax=Iningainema tapete BLCC-T55 TaxID=2748662 RepID=A0A8J7C8U7_9CYAN|nr:class I SAM-dependent methyltransferase [Iningainema tapete]MBD2775156.1 class I SAM-dependent methyltransferase [Iningainema tapete BLCC-T55]
MKDLSEQIKTSYSKDLETRKTWYSPVAEAYNKARPRYPKEIIAKAVELAQLPENATILEVGCGPGNATVGFAQLGFPMVCLEPNQDFSRLAQKNCAQYPLVEIRNTSFEEWELEPERFNAVLAANSFHWIPPEVGYPKAADALQSSGSLILLWNMSPQLDYEIYQTLNEAYQIYAPSLARYEDRKTQEEILKKIGQIVIKSGRFKNLVSEHLPCEVTYSIDDYFTLLNTLSPYLQLEKEKKDSLFALLREKLETSGEGRIQLSYLSACQVAQKL